MESVDVASLLTNVPLQETIEIILKSIYIYKEITTDIPKQEMKELLILFTKMYILHLIMKLTFK